MNRNIAILGLTLVALPVTTFAQSAGEGFRASGTFGISYVDPAGSDGRVFLLSDADFGMTFGAFGADLSVIAAKSDSFLDDGKIMGGVSYTFGNDSRVVVGMPRSGYDTFGKFNIGQTSRYLGVVIPLTDKSNFSLIGPGFTSLDGFGVRYDSATDGALKFSASYLYDRDYEVSGIGGSGEFETGGATFSGGLEYLDNGDDTLTQVKLKAEGTLNLFTWGVAGSYTDASFGAQQSYLEGSILWQPIDQLDVTGFVAQIDGNIVGSDNMLSGVGGKYFFAKGANVGAAAVHSDAGTGYEISVGLDF